MTGPKILVFDIERIPGRFQRLYRGLNIEGEFWDLSQHKHIIGRIYPDNVLEWPRTICVAWRFIGDKRVEFASEWDDGQRVMHERIWKAIDEADIVVGHNVASFDLKHLKTGWRDLGMKPPSPYKIVDTLRVARREFGDESKTLDALTKRAGIPSKTDRYDVEVARAALAGDKKMQRKLKLYNCGDIEASEALYLNQLPWVTGHPHVGLYGGGTDENVCGNCGSEDLIRQGHAYTLLGKFQRFQCRGCGKWSRGAKRIDSVDVRPAA